jgi:hypothetical protein
MNRYGEAEPPGGPEKHLQLGVDPSEAGHEAGDDPEQIDPDDAQAVEALWSDATTVEEFAGDLQALESEDPLVQWELARLRHEAT